jgi:hypothetical protein
MVWTKTEPRPRFGNLLPGRAAETRALVLAAITAAITVVAFWLPVFQVGGFVYTMIDAFGGRGQFIAAVALPIVLGLGAMASGWRWPRCAYAAALAAAVMVTLAPVGHFTEAVLRREHPELLGAPFEFRIGFAVAAVAIVGGGIVFVALMRALLSERPDGEVDRSTDAAAGVAAIGLLLAVAGQLALSSDAHVWELPRWPQVGSWWELLVTSAICGVSVVRRRPIGLAAGAMVAIVGTCATAQQLRVWSLLDDDPAVSSTVTFIGFAIVAVALTAALVRSLRSASVARRA